MRKLISVLIFVGVFFITITCYAVETGNPSSYKITVQQIQMRNSTTNEWIIIASPNEELDLVSGVIAGGTAATFLTDSDIPPGSYDNFKLVISETMRITGSTDNAFTADGGALRLDGADPDVDGSTSTWGGTQPDVDMVETIDTYSATAAGEVAFTVNLHTDDADNYIEVYYDDTNNPALTPIVVSAGSEITMWFDFDTEETVQFINDVEADVSGYTDLSDNGICVFLPPQEGTQFSITVDGTTTTLTASQMRTDF